jgi:hypothetical protein
VVDRVRVTLSGQLEADLTSSTADILRVAAEEQRRAVSDAVERAVAATRQDGEQQLSGARSEFEREREEIQHTTNSERATLERTLDEVRAELETVRQQLMSAQGERDALVGQLDATRTDAERLTRELQDAIEQARHETQRSRLEADDAARELEAVRGRLERTARLASALQTLDRATSMGEILERLAESACQETGRTAVFLVNGEKLRGWRALGFEAGEPIVGYEMDSGDAGLVGEAARSGVGQPHLNGDAAAHLPAFASGHGPRDAVALPVQVGGSVIAVLYADAARADRPGDHGPAGTFAPGASAPMEAGHYDPEWLDTIDTMAAHAGRVLEAMTVRQAAARWKPRRRSRSGDGSLAGIE